MTLRALSVGEMTGAHFRRVTNRGRGPRYIQEERWL
jgi:hypothetical protein